MPGYYFHCFCGASIFIGASIHASTDFYLIFPGLCLYVIDWTMRMFSGEVGGTHNKVEAVVENAGADWYRVSFSSWNKKIERNTSNLFEKSDNNLAYPLKYYYLNIPAISKMQNHAFTAAVPSSSASGPVFLFQRSQGKKQKELDKEWTWKLGSLVPNQNDRTEVQLRLEGPYPPRNTKFETASHIVCVVGGTGMTGAYSLAIWWSETRASMGDSRFTFVWTIRDRKSSMIQEWQSLSEVAARTPRLELVTHVSSEQGRLDPAIHIRRALSRETQGASAVEKDKVDAPASVWVYSAGPDGFVRAVKGACIAARIDVRRNAQTKLKDFDWYIAKWEV